MPKKEVKSQIKKVILAYSGGLDTSVIVPWLKENYGCEVICFTADVGQGEELSGLPAKAEATGASKIYIEDLREEFASRVSVPTAAIRRNLRAQISAGHLYRPAADRQAHGRCGPDGRRRRRRARLHRQRQRPGAL